MTVEEIRNICLSFKGVDEDIKWEDHLCFTIGEKMFVITGPDEVPPTASFKTTPEVFAVLTARVGITPSRYLGKHHWVHVDDISRLNRKQWEGYLHTAYELIAEKLPKSRRKKLGLT
jgi:predicted DNA-binding protein (MmcQ/YjbR family)